MRICLGDELDIGHCSVYGRVTWGSAPEREAMVGLILIKSRNKETAFDMELSTLKCFTEYLVRT